MTFDLIQGTAVVGQSGGPTAVINQSLVGVVEALKGAGPITSILGARNGVRGMIEERFADMGALDNETLERIAITPSAALGSSRDKPDEAYCAKIFEVFEKKNVRYFFYIGGNDSSDTCRIINELSDQAGYELRCFHIPKTIDNDLVCNDHTPGYPSAARFVAKAFMGDNLDNRSLPGIKIDIVMGRHAGFLTAAAALARQHEDDGPHLIYCPERAFDPDKFVADIDRVYTKHGRCLVAVSEGIANAEGESISAMMSGAGEKDAHGNVQLSGSGALGDWLANVVKIELTPQGGKPPRVRADTLGYLQRCYPDASDIDQAEARASGAKAAEVAMSGDLDGSIAIERLSNEPYKSGMKLIKLGDVAAKTKHMPDEFITDCGTDVTDAFIEYVKPLVGALPRTARV